MVESTQLITQELLASGATDFKQWLNSIPAHREEFERHYSEYEPSEEDAVKLRDVIKDHDGTIRTLIVTDTESPGAWRGVAVMAKIAEVCNMEISIVPSAGNEEIVEAFPNMYDETGKPTFVFLDKDGKSLGHLSRRPNQIELDIIRAIEQDRGIEFPLEGPEYDVAVAEYLERDGRQHEKAWRHAQLWETINIIDPDILRLRRGTLGPIGYLTKN